MCEADRRAPYAVPLELHETKAGILVMVFSLLLWKVTEKWNGEHSSSYGFTYPIGRTIRDANARVGNHRRALHFAACQTAPTSLSRATAATSSQYCQRCMCGTR
jgi:hypothetical protein